MPSYRQHIAPVALVVVAGLLAPACAGASSRSHRSALTIAAPARGSTTTVSLPAPALVAWSGPIEHVFFHTLVVQPALAFTHDQLGRGFEDYFVTVGEFASILDQLYANGWTLVDIHQAIAGTVAVPAGRKPLVLSEDDVNYYAYEQGHGLGSRLVLDAAGQLMVEEAGGGVTDRDLVPMVDEFVAGHPLFSAAGAKGVLAVTGYEGLFGERVQDPSAPGYAAAVARARAVADRLKATGWTLASHSYGHIDLTKDSVRVATRDTDRWLAEATPIIGPTDVYVYPFGAAPAPASPTVQMLRARGFAVLCDIDTTARITRAAGVSVMARRHIDGLAFAGQARVLAPFFDVASVEDVAQRR